MCRGRHISGDFAKIFELYKGLFERNIIVKVTVNVYYYVNGDRHFDSQRGFILHTHSAHQSVREKDLKVPRKKM